IDGHPCDDVQGTLVHLSLAGIEDPKIREQLQSIPTGLTIPDEDVDLLIAAGEQQARESPAIEAFRQSLTAAPLTN
ncbi:MAG: hypothetical protein ACREE7_05830, partial [Dongiaceae bacterium]